MAYQRTCELPDVRFFLNTTLEEYVYRRLDEPTLHEIRQRIIKEFRDIKAAGVVFVDDGSMIKLVDFDWVCWGLSQHAVAAFDERYEHTSKEFKPEFLVSFKRYEQVGVPNLPWVFSIG